MKKIVAIMKSKESFKRLKFQTQDLNIEFEEYINDLDDFREKVPFISYDIGIVDYNLWWKDEAVELLNKLDAEIIIFEGDFEDVEEKIRNILPDEVEEIDKEAEEDNNIEENDNRQIRYIEKEVIKEKEIEVKVPIYKEVYTDIPKKLIIIGNLSKRAGSTFLTLNLAKAISEYKILTSIIEPPLDMPYIFNVIGLDMKLNVVDEESLNYYSYSHVIDKGDKIQRDKEFIEDNILWNILDPRIEKDINSWDYYKMMKLIYASKKANISILDVGGNLKHESVKTILNEAEHVFLIIDPMPSELMGNHELLDEFIELKNEGFPVDFIVNKYTTGVRKKELKLFIKADVLSYIPNIDLKYIHEAIYDCKIPYEYPEVKEVLEIPFSDIIEKVIPKEMLSNPEEEKENKGFLKSLFSKK